MCLCVLCVDSAALAAEVRYPPCGCFSDVMCLCVLCVDSVALAAEVCYPPCGCFSNDPPFHNRQLPESPRDQRLSWHLFTRANPDEPVMIEIPENGTDIEIP